VRGMMAVFDDAFISFAAITLTALAYSSVSGYVMRVWGNRARAKEIQDEIKRITRLAQEATKSGDAKRQKEAEEQQGRVPDLMKESMILNFKPLVVTLPIFIAASWLMRTMFPNFKITLGVYLPIFIQNLNNFPNWRNEFGVVGWFILAIFFGGMLMQFIVGKMDEWRRKSK